MPFRFFCIFIVICTAANVYAVCCLAGRRIAGPRQVTGIHFDRLALMRNFAQLKLLVKCLVKRLFLTVYEANSPSFDAILRLRTANLLQYDSASRKIFDCFAKSGRDGAAELVREGTGFQARILVNALYSGKNL
jgi:hypothetical protein